MQLLYVLTIYIPLVIGASLHALVRYNDPNNNISAMSERLRERERERERASSVLNPLPSEICAMSREACLRGFANNTGADQPAHLRRLISAFVVRFLESIICTPTTGKIFIFLASLCS